MRKQQRFARTCTVMFCMGFLLLSLLSGCGSRPDPAGTGASSSIAEMSLPALPTFSEEEKARSVGTLTMLGRASVKIAMNDGRTIYIDPYAGAKADYADPADLVLVTHQDYDHNKVSLVTLRDGGDIIQCPKDIQAGKSIESHGMSILAVEAYNDNHKQGEGCGYVMNLDGFILYHTGDTSMTDEMADLKAFSIDYALLCADGYYNMGPDEAMKVAATIEPRYVLPMHTHKSKDFDETNLLAFTLDNLMALKPGDQVLLVPSEKE